MLDKSLILELLHSKRYKEILNIAEKNKSYIEIPVHKGFQRYIYERRNILLEHIFKKYKLSRKKIYLNKKLKNLIVNQKRNKKYLNFYFLVNQFGYIPNLNGYERFLIINYLLYKTKKEKLFAHPIKAVFCDTEIEFSSPFFSKLLLSFDENYICKKEIYVPFNNFFKNIFLNADILTWDILVAAVNINNLSSVVNLYKFTKQKLISPTSFKQIEPYKTRVNLLIERFNINENWLNQNNKETHFYVPSEFYSVDSKNEFLKRVFYYIFYIGQIKYLKKDKKPIKIISLLSNSGVDFQRLKNQKGFPFIEYKLFSALEKVSDYFSLDINEDYKNFEQFLESKIYISPTKTYREFIGNVLKRKNVV